MDERARIKSTRLVFARVTGEMEDASVAAAEGQAIADLATAQRACDRLIVLLEVCLRRLHRLRRSLG